MIYITEDDLSVFIKEYTIFDILEVTGTTSGNTTIDNAELTGIDSVFSYINNIYDKDVELAKTGTDRDYMLVSNITAFMLYFLYQRVSTNSIPQHIIDNYERVVEMLRDIQNRKNVPKIERKSEDDPTYVPRIVSSSNTRTNYDY